MSEVIINGNNVILPKGSLKDGKYYICVSKRENALSLYTPDKWEELVSSLKNVGGERGANLQRFFLSYAQEITVSEDKFVLPSVLLERLAGEKHKFIKEKDYSEIIPV